MRRRSISEYMSSASTNTWESLSEKFTSPISWWSLLSCQCPSFSPRSWNVLEGDSFAARSVNMKSDAERNKMIILEKKLFKKKEKFLVGDFLEVS
jgi:hypothetical protein